MIQSVAPLPRVIGKYLNVMILHRANDPDAEQALLLQIAS